MNETSNIDDLITLLTDAGDLRVWSVNITIFGDAVLPRGEMVAASTLSQITDRIFIKPEAQRVALSRLARDGWISRHKQGRNSYYRMTDSGMQEFTPATKRIYATGPDMDSHRMIAVAEPMTSGKRDKLYKHITHQGWRKVAPGIWLGDKDAAPLGDDMLLMSATATRIPQWLRHIWGPDELVDGFEKLDAALTAIETTLARQPVADPLDAIALRCLITHQWRRLLLRHPDLPVQFFPRDWKGEICRHKVLGLHAALSPLANQWLDQEFDQDMPV